MFPPGPGHYSLWNTRRFLYTLHPARVRRRFSLSNKLYLFRNPTDGQCPDHIPPDTSQKSQPKANQPNPTPSPPDISTHLICVVPERTSRRFVRRYDAAPAAAPSLSSSSEAFKATGRRRWRQPRRRRCCGSTVNVDFDFDDDDDVDVDNERQDNNRLGSIQHRRIPLYPILPPFLLLICLCVFVFFFCAWSAVPAGGC